jgi:hypothetical protein
MTARRPYRASLKRPAIRLWRSSKGHPFVRQPRVNATAHTNRGQSWSQRRAANTAEAIPAVGYILATSTCPEPRYKASPSGIGRGYPPASQAEGRGFEARRPLSSATVCPIRARVHDLDLGGRSFVVTVSSHDDGERHPSFADGCPYRGSSFVVR